MKDLDNIVQILENSKKILFLTGAGMSADSNIPTFRDKEGYWNNFPVYKDKNLNPEDLANGMNFVNHSTLCWGFYEWRRRNAHFNKPHKGYDVINKFLEKFNAFIITTNTDGYHLRSGTPENKVYEEHGSMWRLQYLDGKDDFVIENKQVPLCDLDEKTMIVCPESVPKHNNKILRPNIFMFCDIGFITNREQYSYKNLFTKKDYLNEKIDTIFLIGSDVGIPSNIRKAKKYQEKGSKIICINPNPHSNGKYLNPDIHIQEKAEKALTELYNSIKGIIL